MYIAIKEFTFMDKQIKIGDEVKNPSARVIELGLVKIHNPKLTREHFLNKDKLMFGKPSKVKAEVVETETEEVAKEVEVTEEVAETETEEVAKEVEVTEEVTPTSTKKKSK